jgi:tRNA nucleotidyltransferase (CCA-adding enzyme)
VEQAQAAPARGRIVRTGAEAITALEQQPGGRELLAAVGGRDDAALVGGAVRDLLLGGEPRELDVTVAHGSGELAAQLAAALGGRAHADEQPARSTVHERFGTASVEWDAGRIDIAELRAESYPQPGALPEVRPAGPEEDLARRDFSVNAISLALGEPRRGELSAVEGALADLDEGRLRVLHERSFIDDPTRLLRLARYGARLRFGAEQRTAELAAAALAAGALGTVSGARIGTELRLALGEADALAALLTLAELGVLGALSPQLSIEEPIARRALALASPDTRVAVLLTALLLLLAPEPPSERRRSEMVTQLDELELPARERDDAIACVLAAPALAGELSAAARPSRLHDVLGGQPPEALVLTAALALAEQPEPRREAAAQALLWLSTLRHVRLQINGDDLLAAGVPEGPAIGEGLARALRLRLDGELAEGRSAELAAALQERA